MHGGRERNLLQGVVKLCDISIGRPQARVRVPAHVFRFRQAENLDNLSRFRQAGLVSLSSGRKPAFRQAGNLAKS